MPRVLVKTADLLEAWETTLEGIDSEFSEKVGDIAAYLKNLKSDWEDLKHEGNSLKERRIVKEKAIRRTSEGERRQFAEIRTAGDSQD